MNPKCSEVKPEGFYSAAEVLEVSKQAFHGLLAHWPYPCGPFNIQTLKAQHHNALSKGIKPTSKG